MSHSPEENNQVGMMVIEWNRITLSHRIPVKVSAGVLQFWLILWNPVTWIHRRWPSLGQQTIQVIDSLLWGNSLTKLMKVTDGKLFPVMDYKLTPFHVISSDPSDNGKALTYVNSISRTILSSCEECLAYYNYVRVQWINPMKIIQLSLHYVLKIVLWLGSFCCRASNPPPTHITHYIYKAHCRGNFARTLIPTDCVTLGVHLVSLAIQEPIAHIHTPSLIFLYIPWLL